MTPEEQYIAGLGRQSYVGSLNNYNAMYPQMMGELGYVQNKLTPAQQEAMNSWQSRYNAVSKPYNELVAGAGGNVQANRDPYERQMIALESELAALKNPGYRKMTEDERVAGMTPLERLQYDNETLQAQRTGQALRGELEVSPALEKSLGQEQSKQEEYLAQTLGPQWRNSTSGNQSMTNLNEKADLVREEARRGMISEGTQLELARANTGSNLTSATLNNLTGTTQGGLAYIGAANQTLNPYFQDRQLGLEQQRLDAARNSQKGGSGWGSMLGSLAGMAIGSFGGGLGMGAGKAAGSYFGSLFDK